MKLSVRLFSLLILCFTVGSIVALAEQGILAVKVLDTRNQPLKNIVLGPSGPGNSGTPTDALGLTRIKLPSQTHPTDIVELDVVSPRDKFVFISPWDQRLVVPAFENRPEDFVRVTLGLPGDRDLLSNDAAIRAMASKVVKLLSSNGAHEVTPELRRAALTQVATIFGIQADEIDQSIRTWGARVQDPYDKGIAALYAGNYSQAQQQLQIASDNRREDLETSIKRYADAKFFLGQCLYLQGKYQTAADAFREALKWRPDDPLVLNNLALNLAQVGNLNDAETFYRQSVDRQRTSSSHDDFLLSQSIGSLGGVLLRENKLEAAEPLLRESLTIRRQSLPSDDPRIATSMNNLAVLLQVQGKLDEAEALLTEALSIQKRAAETPRLCPKPSSAQNAVTITCTALLSESQRSMTTAQSQETFPRSAANSQSTLVTVMSRGSSEVSEKSIVGLSSLAQQRPGVASTMCNLAILYVARGSDLSNAESLARNAIQAEEQALPPNHPDLATSYDALGTVLAAENKVHDARWAFQRALEIRLLNFGPEHIYLAEIYESISRVELKDDPAAAKEDLNHALGIETKWWGDTDPRTQATQRNLAKIGAN